MAALAKGWPDPLNRETGILLVPIKIVAFGEFALCRELLTAFVLDIMVVIDVSYLLRPAERISGTLLRFWVSGEPVESLETSEAPGGSNGESMRGWAEEFRESLQGR